MNATEHYSFGSSELYEPFTFDIRELFRSLQKTYGRCISKMYIDLSDGTSKVIGWVFLKTKKYTDTKEKYIQEAWVEPHKQQPTVTVTNHFQFLDEVKNAKN